MNKLEIQIAGFAVCIAIANVIIQIIGKPKIFIQPFSIGLSLLIFYFAYRELREWDIIKNIRNILFTHHLENEAFYAAKDYIEGLKNETTKQKSKS